MALDGLGFNIGALIVRIGSGVYCTIIIYTIRNPPKTLF